MWVKAEGEPSGELVIANWPLYIDKETIPEFEQETGISVKYVEEINSYDEFFREDAAVPRAWGVRG